MFDAIALFSACAEILFSEASEIGFDDALTITPNDPYFDRLWALSNTGQVVRGRAGQPGVDIDVLNAWATTKGDPDVIISVIDSGMDINHPDLNPNLLSRGSEDWDFASDDGVPQDQGSHGTHVCGTTVAVMDNAIGMVGVAPECRIMPLRINLTAGMNQNRADAVNYVATQAIKYAERKYVINCSWRASGNYSAILYAIINAVQNGAVVIFAAGNASNDMDVTPQYAGVYEDVIAVAALDSSNIKASFLIMDHKSISQHQV